MVFRFDPFRDVDRLAEQLLGSQRAPRVMPMDLFRSGDHYVVACDLPGVDPGSVDISVDGGVLTIRAERTPRSDEQAQWLAQERPSGTFLRQLTLGEGLDTEHIGATYENGVLTVTLPVAEKARPRRIQVTTADQGGGRVLEGSAGGSLEAGQASAGGAGAAGERAGAEREVASTPATETRGTAQAPPAEPA
jgi:HSP20 family protein